VSTLYTKPKGASLITRTSQRNTKASLQFFFQEQLKPESFHILQFPQVYGHIDVLVILSLHKRAKNTGEEDFSLPEKNIPRNLYDSQFLSLHVHHYNDMRYDEVATQGEVFSFFPCATEDFPHLSGNPWVLSCNLPRFVSQRE
jgi:hypothetical protein